MRLAGRVARQRVAVAVTAFEPVVAFRAFALFGAVIASGALGALGACAYHPSSFRDSGETWAGQRTTIGCVDLAVERRGDLTIGPVLRYHFANRCDRAITIDLAQLAVIGRAADGAEHALVPYDPTGELRVAALEARSVGAEALAYPAAGAVPQICVDAATLVHASPARWLCLGAAPPPGVGSAPATSAGGAPSVARSAPLATAGSASPAVIGSAPASMGRAP